MPRRVTTIPASISRYTATPINSRKKRKAAGYARVSTDHEDQVSSYEAQVDYYTNYIKRREDWEFAGIYTDEGITATNTRHREGFNRMVEDALAGKIDLIVTKSVSRFARNTVDSLTTVRKLKEAGIEVYFEKENIWTLDSKGELLITIMSSLAQEESRSISENCTWGQRKRFADGKVSFAYTRFLGYDQGEDGSIVINEEQAATVRRIYGMFLQGRTPYAIAKQLTKEKIPTPAGKEKWGATVIWSILTNEKYKGDALLQKSYTVDFLTKKTKVNEGEVPQYYVQNNHTAIIKPEVFDMVQQKIRVYREKKQRTSCVNTFSGKIKCGDCGNWYGSKVWHSNDKYRKVIWQCNNKFKGEKKCGTPHVDEETIKELFLKAVSIVFGKKEELARNFSEMKDIAFDTSGWEQEREQLQEEMTVVSELIHQCIRENARVAQDQEEYQKKYDALVRRYDTAKDRLDEVDRIINEKQARKAEIELFLAELDKVETVTEFHEDTWYALLDYVTVYDKEDIRFTFKDGTEIRA